MQSYGPVHPPRTSLAISKSLEESQIEEKVDTSLSDTALSGLAERSEQEASKTDGTADLKPKTGTEKTHKTSKGASGLSKTKSSSTSQLSVTGKS